MGALHSAEEWAHVKIIILVKEVEVSIPIVLHLKLFVLEFEAFVLVQFHEFYESTIFCSSWVDVYIRRCFLFMVMHAPLLVPFTSSK